MGHRGAGARQPLAILYGHKSFGIWAAISHHHQQRERNVKSVKSTHGKYLKN